jgi:hypothetical protein
MTRRFGSLSSFFCLRFTTPKPSCFRNLFSVVGGVAVSFSESFGTVINGHLGDGVGVTSGSCVTELALGWSTAVGADACVAAIWIPHIAAAMQVDNACDTDNAITPQNPEVVAVPICSSLAIFIR